MIKSYYVWGTLSVLLVLGCLALFMPSIAAILTPLVSVQVGVPIAFLCTFIITFYLFSLREELHRYTHTRSFSEQNRKPLPILVLITFVLAILLAFFLAFGLASQGSLIGYESNMIEPDSFEFWLLKMSMTGVLILFFVLLSLSAGLMTAYQYGKVLDQDAAKCPIYANQQKLKNKVLSAAKEELETTAGHLSVLDMKRLGDGGISLTLYREGDVQDKGGIKYREDKKWLVVGDYKGDVTKIQVLDTRLLKIS